MPHLLFAIYFVIYATISIKKYLQIHIFIPYFRKFVIFGIFSGFKLNKLYIYVFKYTIEYYY